MANSGSRHVALIALTAGALALALPQVGLARGFRGGGGARPALGARGGGVRAAPTSINGARGNFSGNRNISNNGNRTAINSGNRVVNNNVNVNVDRGWDNHCCYHGGAYYHPVATGIAIGATAAVTAAVVGSVIYSLPPACTPYNAYYHCGAVWYEPRYSGTSVTYVVVNEPPH